jgi:hypothetical protein
MGDMRSVAGYTCCAQGKVPGRISLVWGIISCHAGNPSPGRKFTHLPVVLLVPFWKEKEVCSHCRTSDPEMETPDTFSVFL